MLGTSDKQFKNRFFLSLFFFDSFILFTGHFLSFNEVWHTFKYFDFLFITSIVAFYPFYYLYLYSAFNMNFIKAKFIVHFIPAIVIGLVMLIISYTASWNEYYEYMQNNLNGTPLKNTTSKILSYLYKGSRAFHLIQIVIYNFLAIRFILKARKQMNNLFSNLDKYQLKYFYIANISFIICMSVPGVFVTILGRKPINTDIISYLVLCSLFTLLYIILAIVGLKQIPAKINISSKEDKTENKISLSNIEADFDLNEIHQNLMNYFDKKKPWLQPDLNIWDVSKNIGSNRTYVSKVINEEIGCNFNQFVNGYRIEEAKKLLTKTPLIPISEISELSGFGSVNSFIRIFKASELCTPNQYRM